MVEGSRYERGEQHIKNTVVLFKGWPNADNRIASFARIMPLSLLSVAAPLRDVGFKVIIIDQSMPVADHVDELKNIINDILFVGISALTGPEIKHGINFVEKLRQVKADIPVVMGGWHASILPEQTLNNPMIDVVVIGPGQRPIVEIAELYRAGKTNLNDIDNIAFKNGSRITFTKRSTFSMEGISLPAFDLIDLDFYRRESIKRILEDQINGIKITGQCYYVTSFGCPLRCNFCCNNLLYSNRWYGYDVEKVIDQIDLLSKNGFNLFVFDDANFLFKSDRVSLICKNIIDRKLKIAWHAQATIHDIIRYEKLGLLPLLRESGCYALSVGIESGDDTVLKGLNKMIPREKQLLAAKILSRHGIEGRYNFLFAIPKHENKRSVYKSLELAAQLKRIQPACLLPLAFYTPFPMTRLFQDAVDIGFEPPQSLEEWGEYSTEYDSSNLFWHDAKMRKTIENAIYYYIPLGIPGDQARGSVRNFKTKLEKGRLKIFFRLIHFISRARIRTQFYSCGIDILLYKFFNRVIYGEGRYK